MMQRHGDDVNDPQIILALGAEGLSSPILAEREQER
jgi:hypothetical protein